MLVELYIKKYRYLANNIIFPFLSGTLNPALQDRNGQPKRDITTIIHILNDLLCAQYKNYSPGMASESGSTTKANATMPTASSSSAATSSSKAQHSEPHKSENIKRSGSNPCSCSKDHLAEINTPLLQNATTSKSVNSNNLIFPENIGEGNVNLISQTYTKGTLAQILSVKHYKTLKAGAYL